LHDFGVERMRPVVGERRILPVASGWIGIQVAADEAVLLHAALELGNARRRRHARRLRQLADADEVVRVERAAAMHQLVADLAPDAARLGVADVMRHRARARWKGRKVRCPAALELELRALQALPDLIVGDVERALARRLRGILERLHLQLAPCLHLGGRGRVVAVAVDDHARSSSTLKPLGIMPSRWTQSIATSRWRRTASMPTGFMSSALAPGKCAARLLWSKRLTIASGAPGRSCASASFTTSM